MGGYEQWNYIFATLDEFQDALNTTALYRSERIAIKHIDNLRNDLKALNVKKSHR